MIYPVPFRAEHLRAMKLQAAQAWAAGALTTEALRAFEGPHAATVMRDGRPVMAGGAVRIWDDRAYLWAWLADDMAPGEFLAMHRLVKRHLDSLPFRRIEAAVDVAFEQGHRWMKFLGFTCETPDTAMTAFLPNGADCRLYSKVK